MEKDENWLPPTRSDRGLPPKEAAAIPYEEYLEDSPIYTIAILLLQQVMGLTAYFSKPILGLGRAPILMTSFF